MLGASTATRRILMIAACPLPAPRGTPVRIHRMAEALAGRGHPVDVAAYHLGVPGEAAYRLHRARTVRRVRRLAAGPSAAKLFVLDPLLERKVRSLLRNGEYDVIHAHHYEGLLVALAAGARAHAPIVFDAHTVLSSELPFYGLGAPRRLLRGLGSFLDRTLPARADHIVTVGDAIRTRYLETGIDAARITVVPNGAETERFECTATRPLPTEPCLLFAGNLASYQGIEILLRSLRLVRERHAGVRLRILIEPSLGDGLGARRDPGDHSLGEYEALAAELGIRSSVEVRPTTYDALPEELGAGAIALSPRLECDGVPLKLSNYMAAGRAIVSFASSGRCLVDGATALLAPDGDIAAFARGIERLLADPALAARLGRNARADAERRHSWGAIAESIERVYDRAIAAETREGR